MNKYQIDEQETFAINEELGARVEIMGWQEFPIVYIDDFYKNPDLVRNLAISCPATGNPLVLKGVPGKRVDMNMDLKPFFNVWEEVAQNVFGLTKEEVNPFRLGMFRNGFTVNVTQSEDRSKLPHIDCEDVHERGWAGIIYLNKLEECNGGTAFYNYKGNQVNPKDAQLWSEVSVQGSTGPWEMIHCVEMKYNRFIMYPFNVLHGAYDCDNFYKDDLFRLTQVFFLPAK